MRIHQFVHTLNYGDAISGEALAIRRLLLEMGHDSVIYSVHAHEKVEQFTKNYRFFRKDMEGGAGEEKPAVILHYSIASPLNDLLIAEQGIQRGLIYHNLTPVDWFAPYNARVSADLLSGIQELPHLLEEVDFVWADSQYNCLELKKLACQQVEVLPLLLEQDKWSLSANPGISGVLDDFGGRNILHVGRLAPNKCIEDIIKAFYFYHHKIEEKSRLWLIGTDVDTEIYSFELRRLVSELRLKEAVFFVGAVSNCELRAFYEHADLYLCMSEHEGFCLPLLEAMHFRVPVVAYDACAVSETLGDGGVLLAGKRPAEVAELIDLLITDAPLRESMIERGLQRISDFSEERFKQVLSDKVVKPLMQTAGSE